MSWKGKKNGIRGLMWGEVLEEDPDTFKRCIIDFFQDRFKERERMQM